MSAENDPDAARAQAGFQQGLALHQQGRLAQAGESYRQVLELQPEHADALHLLGVVAYQSGDPLQAVELIGRAIALNPGNANAHSNRGLALQGLTRPAEALESYDRALELKPDYAEAYSNRGNALKDLKRLDEALDSYDRALELKPDFAEAWNNRGFALQELRQLDEALESYDRAIELSPGYADAYCNRGNVLQELERLDEALVSYDRAVALDPGNAEAHYNRGLALQELKRLEDALESYDRAIELKPRYVDAYNNRGLVLKELKRLDEALDSYHRAVELKPDFADGHLNLSLCRLLMGDFARGWKGFEWRWQSVQLESSRNFTQPLWLGAESLQGKTILLHSEQGLGDALQFCRYASLASASGARVILEVPKPLTALLRNLAGVAQVVEKGTALPPFDFHCPLLSLPLAFKTDLNSVPSFKSYIGSNPRKVADWRVKLGERTKPRVGLAWRGSAMHKNDRNRSIALANLVKDLPPQFQYVSLQKETTDADEETLGLRRGILHFGEQLDDFTDTAALCELMDVVISVDTSVAHLAGAMGRPVWVLLPFIPDWRWLLDREDSVWYPSARLFRQERNRDWAGVIDRVRTALIRRPAAD
jgi:tetratricopeptide (TPR) repeat protein/ADP-heptose:LPS heptosyltransferase